MSVKEQPKGKSEKDELAELENKQTQTMLTDAERIRLNDLRYKKSG